MKKTEKVELAKEIREFAEQAQAILLAEYRGLTVGQISNLRTQLRELGTEAKVYKNRLFKKAVLGLKMEGLDPFLNGPTIFLFNKEEGVSTAKAIIDFAKENDKLQVKAAFVDGQVLNKAGVETLSRLPSKTELQSQIAGGINTLLGTVTTAIDSLLQEFVGLIEAQEKALGGGEA